MLDFQQFILQVFFHLAHFQFCLGSLGAALFLNIHDIIQSSDQLLIGLLQSLNIHDSALRFPGSLCGCKVKCLRIFLQKLICQVCYLALGLGCFCGMGDSKCQHHLALPKWNGIYNGCLDFFLP